MRNAKKQTETGRRIAKRFERVNLTHSELRQLFERSNIEKVTSSNLDLAADAFYFGLAAGYKLGRKTAGNEN